MNEAHQVYVPPKPIDAKEIPSAIRSFLDGNDLPSKPMNAIRLSTVNEEGWAHASLLSVGEVLALPNAKIRFAISPRSSTTANLLRDGRLTMVIPFEKGVCEMRLRSQQINNQEIEGVPLTFFEAQVESIRHLVSAYADILSGETFSLHEPHAVFARWDKQIAALRSL
jgi:Pyridoxamine 5'-phosphate oxidase